MISVKHLTKRFGSYTAVNDLSVEVGTQRAVALWGPNGAGKTTVIKCVLGLLHFEGSILVQGCDAQKQGRAARSLLGYVPQELAFWDDLNTLQTALFFARLRGAPAERAPVVLTQVGLEDAFDKDVRALSGGMKQRLALGLALLADPPVLVLDEPTSSLDTAARGQFLALLSQVKAQGKTILFTSHRIEEVEALADTVLVMERGRVVQTCSGAELAEQVGLRTQVKLHMAPASLDRAASVLQAEGYQVHRNGVGILVEVAPREKARPIHLLSQADIHVTDFETE